MQKKDLLEKMSAVIQLDESKINLAMDILLQEITNALIAGQRIEIRDFGSWSSIYCPAREVRNPKTNEKVLMTSRRKIRFKPGKKLLEQINQSSDTE